MLPFVIVFRNCLVAFGSDAISWSGKQTKNICKQCLNCKREKGRQFQNKHAFQRNESVLKLSQLQSFVGILSILANERCHFFSRQKKRHHHACVQSNKNGTSSTGSFRFGCIFSFSKMLKWALNNLIRYTEEPKIFNKPLIS